MKVNQQRVPFFDLDWTLISGGSPVHRQAFVWAIKQKFGIEVQIEINIQGMIDRQILYELALNAGVDKQRVLENLVELVTLTNEYFVNNSKEEIFNSMPGADTLLSTLNKQNIPVGILTGNTQVIGKNKLKKTGLDKYIKYEIYGDDYLQRHELVKLAYAQLQQNDTINNMSNLVIIGDTVKDIECARKSGALSLAVATGKYHRDDLSEADFVVDSLTSIDEIINFLKFYEDSK